MGSPERAAAATPPRQPSPPTVFFYKKFVMCVRRGGERPRKPIRLRLPAKAFLAVARRPLFGGGSAPRLFRCSRSARGMRPAAWAPRQAPHWPPSPGSPPVSVFSVSSWYASGGLGTSAGSALAALSRCRSWVFWFRGGSWGARGLVVAPTVFFCAPFSLVLYFFCAPFSLVRNSGASSGALGCFGHKKRTKTHNQLRKRRILRSCQLLPKRTEGRRR